MTKRPDGDTFIKEYYATHGFSAQLPGQGISIKLFLGCLIPPDIHLLLTNNSAWKEKNITHQEEYNVLKIVHHEGRNYLGTFLKSPIQKLQEIKELEFSIKKEIFQLCPELDQPTQKLFIFPQVFIS